MKITKAARHRRLPTATQILVVDDEPAVATLISRILTDAQFQVTQTGTGSGALLIAAELNPDLILLDLLLPDMHGENVLTELLSTHPGRRVIVLTAVTDIATRVEVLACGAVDYMAKPFANTELVARVRARMRDPEDPSDCSADAAGPAPPKLELDSWRRAVRIGGHEITLTSREFSLLAYLLQRAPAPCSKAELFAAVWGTPFHTRAGGNLVETHICRLRFKITPTKIQMVRGVGYRLVDQ